MDFSELSNPLETETLAEVCHQLKKENEELKQQIILLTTACADLKERQSLAAEKVREVIQHLKMQGCEETLLP